MNSLTLSIALRYLKSKRSGFLSLISKMGFIGIAMGVAVLIIVTSVMNGFRTELINKIVGFNAHVTVKPYETTIDTEKLKNNNLKLHLIGRLQTNKVKFAVKLFDYIHSLDSKKLADKICKIQKL